jgi:RNA polymerase sigma factor (sigma-70 family)
LAVKYQSLVKYQVSKLVVSTNRQAHECDDMVQETLLALIEKKDYLREHFNPDKLFRNYLWTIIINILLNLLKSNQRYIHLNLDISAASGIQSEQWNPELQIGIKDSCRQFEKIISQYGNDRPKLELCIKTALSIPLSVRDVEELFHQKNEILSREAEILCEQLNKSTKSGGFSQGERFSLLAPLLRRYDKSQTNPASYLHWTNHQITQIILKLNMNGLNGYTKETFSILAEMYFIKNPSP